MEKRYILVEAVERDLAIYEQASFDEALDTAAKLVRERFRWEEHETEFNESFFKGADVFDFLSSDEGFEFSFNRQEESISTWISDGDNYDLELFVI